MGTFDPRPNWQRWDGGEQLRIGLDTPYSPLQAAGESIIQGALDSFGLGTAIRELTTPPLEDPTPTPFRGETPENLRGRTERAQENALSEEEYKASPFFRESVPWQEGMTTDRAAALAAFADKRAVRQKFSEKQPIAAFLGGFVGQAFDPVNYVPVFGPVARVAAVSRFGSIAGRAMLGAGEAAINTAAFGIMTAGIRERLGDDVSFAVMGSEIAMSALIGGAFGGAVGVFAAGRDARARLAASKVADALKTIERQQKSNITLNNAIDDLVNTGEVSLNPNALANITEAVNTKAERASSGAKLAQETARVEGNRIGDVVITPTGRRVAVRPEVVELDTLIHAEGDLQVRNRRGTASAVQVEEMAVNLDPARLMPAIAADQGAPLVGEDSVIDSGNGRTMAIRRVYENPAYGAQAESYRKALAEAGYDVSTMRQPVLIQRRLTRLSPEARSQFNAEANSSSTARMSAVEVAQMDRSALTDNVMAVLDDAPVDAASNRAFVQRFLAEIPPLERAALTVNGDKLSAEGVRRIENALVAKAFGDVDAGVVRRFAEATDDSTRSIVGAMSDVAGAWSKFRSATRDGTIDSDLDATKELTDALRLLAGWREQAASEGRPVSMVIREGMAQLDMLSGEIAPETQVFVRMFYKTDTFTQAVGRETLAGRLLDVLESGYELGRPSLFGDQLPDVSKLEVLQNAIRRNAETDLFASGDAVSRFEEVSAARAGFAAETTGGGDRQGAGEGEQAPYDAKLSVVDRPQNRAFDAWIKGSKVKDVVYHGSRSLVAEPGANRAFPYDGGVAMWFAQDPRLAHNFIGGSRLAEPRIGLGRDGVGSNIMPAYVSIKKPFKFSNFREYLTLKQVLERAGITDRGEQLAAIERMEEWARPRREHHEAKGSAMGPVSGTYGDVGWSSKAIDSAEARLDDSDNKAGWQWAENSALISVLKERGFDGIQTVEKQKVSKALSEGKRASKKAVEEVESVTWAPFSGEQVKSRFDAAFAEAEEILYEADVLAPSAGFRQAAWHGTPHVFERFSLDKVGTGEGAQSYGYGLYFAGEREVAEYYRDNLSQRLGSDPSRSPIKGKTLMEWYQHWQGLGDKATNPAEFYDRLAMLEETELTWNAQAALRNAREEGLHPKAIEWFETTIADEFERPGSLYRVDLPDDAELLDWDKSFEEQAPELQQAVIAAGRALMANNPRYAEMATNWRPPGDRSLGSVYMDLALGSGADTKTAQRLASEALRDAGIPGLRYLDQNSRNAGDGTYNYVIWDESRVEIAERNDTPVGYLREDGEPIDLRGFSEEELQLAFDLSTPMPKPEVEPYDASGQLPSPPTRVLGRQELKRLREARALRETMIRNHMIDAPIEQVPPPVTPPDNPPNRSRVRTVGASEVKFDDEYTAELFDLGDYLLVLNDVTPEQAAVGDFPRNVRIGPAMGEAERLAGVMGNYLIRDATVPMRNMGDFARWAMGFAGDARDEAATKANLGRTSIEVGNIIEPELRQQWDRFVNDEVRAQVDELTRVTAPNGTTPPPDPAPDGMDAAAASAKAPVTAGKLGESYGLDAEMNGPEAADVDALRQQGALTPEDEEALAAADQLYADAEAYEKTLNVLASVSCLA